MPTCTKCGDTVSMPFTCKFCEHPFCATHRLPENHDCEGLEAYKEQSREEGKVGYEAPKRQPKRSATPTPQSTTGHGDEGLLGPVDTWMDHLIAALPTTATNTVLGVIFAAFFLTYLTDPGTIFSAFALDPTRTLFQPWRLVTSIFLHGGMAHLLINSIVLYSFGSEAERMLGRKRFLTVLFGAALASSIGYVLAAFLFQGVPDLPFLATAIPGATQMTGFTPAVGISGGLYGLVVLLAVLRPRIQVLAFFVVPLKIRTAVALFVAMDALNLLTHAVGVRLPVVGGFASAGHLSGALVGYYVGKKLKDRYAQRRRTINLFRGPGGFRA